MSAALDKLLRRTDIWLAGASPPPTGPAAVACQWPALAPLLPGAGWPLGALTEILCDSPTAVAVLMPALRSLAQQGRPLVWLAPPWPPYAPALALRGIDLNRVWVLRPRQRDDALWAAEQWLRGAAGGALLAWLDPLQHRELRRLQLAAEEGGALAVLFRGRAAAGQHSPAALRLELRLSPEGGWRAWVIKCRGGRPGGPVAW